VSIDTKKSDPKRWFVYVIANARNELYTGITFDTGTDRRLRQHNDGTGAKYTRGRGPWQIVHVESDFENRAQAQAREYQIKHDPDLKRRFKCSTPETGGSRLAATPERR
jgi:putative endonuclease